MHDIASNLKMVFLLAEAQTCKNPQELHLLLHIF